MRIACVQNGDYTQARRELRSGAAETYGGQRYTVEAFEGFVAPVPHLVVSLHAHAHEEREGNGEYSGIVPPPRIPMMPGRMTENWKARRIIARLERFAPTHLVLRCNDRIGCRLLEWARKRGVQTAVIIASRFDPGDPVARAFVKEANDGNVLFVANHNRVATQSLIETGLHSDKAIAWDYPPAAEPKDYPAKTRGDGKGKLKVVFAGVMSEDKGVGDLLAAGELLASEGVPIELVACGEGPMVEVIRSKGYSWMKATGRLAHDRVIEAMRDADVVVVPTRHAFPEALPLVILEGLAVRCPMILSDHPVFKSYFRDGEGVRIVKANSPVDLARVLKEMAGDLGQYARLSEQTARVWAGLQIETRFHHLLERISDVWGMPRKT